MLKVSRIIATALLIGFLSLIQICETGGRYQSLRLSHTAMASSALPQSTATDLSIEAESMTGDGEVVSRENAQGGKTVALKSGDTREHRFNLPASGVYSIDVRYSNDGSRDTIEVSVDDGLYTGSFASTDTRPPGGEPGSGWNNFASSTKMGPFNLAAGDHVLKLTATATDEYGVEIDALNLIQQPAGTTSSPELEGPIATIITDGLSIREGPGTNYPRIGVAVLHQWLPVLGKWDAQCSWLRVETADGMLGWMSGASRYVDLSEDCDTIPLAEPPEESEQTVTQILEAESAVGDGDPQDRSEANGEKTVALDAAQSQDYFFELPFDGDYTLTVRYSNDGGSDTIGVNVDDEPIDAFDTKDTRPAGGTPGSGWNSFTDSIAIGPISLSAGDHVLSLIVEDADEYGVEIDAVSLSGIEGAVTPPKPSAVVVSSGIRIKEGPNSELDNVSLVRRGAELVVSGKLDDDCTWLKVVAPDGAEGWIQGGTDFVTLYPSCAEVPLVEIVPPQDTITLLLDAESVGGDATVSPRSEANSDATVLLGTDDGLQFPVDLPLDGRYGLELQYSNDGGIDTVEISVDGAFLGEFQTDNTRPAGGVSGSGWNVFASSGVFETEELSAGEHTVDVFVSRTDAFGVELDVLRIFGPLTPTLTITASMPPTVSVEIPGESGRGDGQMMSRSEADDDSTVWLHDGESRIYSFTMPRSAVVSINVLYSNDNNNAGPFESVEVIVDGASVGEFSPIDTGDNGEGWNVFEWSGIIGEIDLDAGEHQLEIEVTGGDGYGVEIDAIELLSVD